MVRLFFRLGLGLAGLLSFVVSDIIPHRTARASFQLRVFDTSITRFLLRVTVVASHQASTVECLWNTGMLYFYGYRPGACHLQASTQGTSKSLGCSVTTLGITRIRPHILSTCRSASYRRHICHKNTWNNLISAQALLRWRTGIIKPGSCHFLSFSFQLHILAAECRVAPIRALTQGASLEGTWDDVNKTPTKQ